MKWLGSDGMYRSGNYSIHLIKKWRVASYQVWFKPPGRKPEHIGSDRLLAGAKRIAEQHGEFA